MPMIEANIHTPWSRKMCRIQPRQRAKLVSSLRNTLPVCDSPMETPPIALGMAPMSGFERSAIAPLWARVGAFLYEHGNAVYNFQGLRAFKEKFNPEWSPCYLAYPGGLSLPGILADVAALVAGGYRRVVFR